MNAIRHLLVCAGAGACLGCSTPRVALDHANNGMQLTQGLQEELRRHKDFMEASAERRKAVVQRLDSDTLQAASGRAMDDYLDQASGRQPLRIASMRRLDEATRKYGALQTDERAARKDLADRLAATTKDLPASGDKLSAVRKAMANLGTELSAQDRFEIVQKFVGEAQDIVKKNASAAEAAASSAGQ